MARLPLADEIAAARALCSRLDLGLAAPVLLKAAHHTTLRLAPLGIAARVQSAEPPGLAWARATRELAVAAHLIAQGAPVAAPLAGATAGPHRIGSATITLWHMVDHDRAADEDDADVAAAALAVVHRGLRSYRGALPPYTDALDRCGRLLHEPAGIALTDADRTLLAAHLARLRREIAAADAPYVPLHGDVHLGNILIGAAGPVWIDWEDNCLGPVELDIAGLPPAAWCRFGQADPALIRRCADLKSVCVAIWCAADPSRSAAVREAAAYHLGRVRTWDDPSDEAGVP